MPIFTIAFELRNASKNHNYDGLRNELKAQKCHPLLQNYWLSSINNDATQLHTHFKRFLDKGDRLMVSELVQHFTYSNALPNCNQWLAENPSATSYNGSDTIGEMKKKAAGEAGAKLEAKPAAVKKPAAKKVPAENPAKPAAASKKSKAKA